MGGGGGAGFLLTPGQGKGKQLYLEFQLQESCCTQSVSSETLLGPTESQAQIEDGTSCGGAHQEDMPKRQW